MSKPDPSPRIGITKSVHEPDKQTEDLATVLTNVAKSGSDHSKAQPILLNDSDTGSFKHPSLRRGAAYTLAAGTVTVSISATVLTGSAGLGYSIAVIALLLWPCIAILVWQALAHHPHKRFGAANIVTTIRAVATVILASLIPEADLLSTPAMNLWLWVITTCAIVVLSLDGLDGYLARRSALSSAMGARFDMEIDSLLALVIALFIWRSGEVGVWILGLGVMRYAFLLASVWFKPLSRRLYPSMRRKTVCVIQLAALCALLSPIIQPPLSIAIGVTALICLTASFARDIHWLNAHAG